MLASKKVNKMITCSVVMPVFNVEKFVEEAVISVLSQSLTNIELLIIDDCGTDNSIALCQRFDDPRIRIIRHAKNKGLAAARNTGIRSAKGQFVAFLDSDDKWHKDKLARHIHHLESAPEVGLSFSRSEFMDESGNMLNLFQMPRLTAITPEYLFQRNPVGNGSAPVLRRQTLKDIAFEADTLDGRKDCYFDESFRRSEDIECWLRIMLTTHWQVEGIGDVLTYYRLNNAGLSASLHSQFDSWRELARKAADYSPDFAAKHTKLAKAFQLRYIARQAVRQQLGKEALRYSAKALLTHPAILFREPARTAATMGAAMTLFLLPSLYGKAEQFATRQWSKRQLSDITQN